MDHFVWREGDRSTQACGSIEKQLATAVREPSLPRDPQTARLFDATPTCLISASQLLPRSHGSTQCLKVFERCTTGTCHHAFAPGRANDSCETASTKEPISCPRARCWRARLRTCLAQELKGNNWSTFEARPGLDVLIAAPALGMTQLTHNLVVKLHLRALHTPTRWLEIDHAMPYAKAPATAHIGDGVVAGIAGLCRQIIRILGHADLGKNTRGSLQANRALPRWVLLDGGTHRLLALE